MPGTLTWVSDERCSIGDVTFQTLPPGLMEGDRPHIEMRGADFLLFKERHLVQREADLIQALAPRNVFELGILWGGSTGFLLEAAKPDRLAAIDLNCGEWPELRSLIARREYRDRAHLFGGVNQEDRVRLAEIVAEVFGDEPLDLVVDDCSHLYEATRSSFSELFPRVRPGGAYVIEDWSWAHARLDEPAEGFGPGAEPLTRLLFELMLAIPAMDGLIDDISVDEDAIVVRRGVAEVDPHGFDISSCSHERGRRLLSEYPPGPPRRTARRFPRFRKPR